MGTRLDLPNGEWADIRDADAIPRKAARAFRKVLYRLSSGAADIDPRMDPDEAARAAASELLKSDSTLDGIEDMADALVFAVVNAWSYGPVDQPTLDEMPDSAVDAIYQAAIAGGYMDNLMPDFGVSPDEDSPTKPSRA